MLLAAVWTMPSRFAAARAGGTEQQLVQAVHQAAARLLLLLLRLRLLPCCGVPTVANPPDDSFS